MKRLLKRMNAKREGATLITVVIATAFLIAIGVVILGASTKYLASVYVDRNATENLYDSEGVLAEVRAGLLEYANEAGKDAYRLIVENYDTIGYDVTVDALGHEIKTPVTLRDRFATLFIAGIVDRLRGLYVKGEWDNSLWDDPSGTPSAARRAYNFLKDNSYINDPDIPGVAPKMIEFKIDHLKALSTHPSYVTTSLLLKNSLFADPENPTEEESARSKLGCIVYRSASKGYSLVIKGMAIDYNEDPYRQTIETDIRINVPDYKFDGDDLLDSASDFVAIADGKINISGTEAVGTGGARFSGNVYAGGKHALGIVGYPESGIFVGPAMEAHFDCQKLITRENITLISGSDVEVKSKDMAGEAYMRNIKLLRLFPVTLGL